MDVSLLLLITGFALLVINYIRNYLNNYEKNKRIVDAIEHYGGETWYPFIGTTLSFIKAKRQDFYDAFMERNRKYGPLFRSYTGSIPSLHIMKAEHIEPVLRSNTNLTKGDNYRFVTPWLGGGLISGSGPNWRVHRKLLTPTFHFSILDNMTEVFSERGQVLASILLEKADGKFFDVFPLLSHCALDIICETAMGVQMDSMKTNAQSEYVNAIYDIAEIILHRMFHPYLHPNFIFNYLSPKGREQKKTLSILHNFTRKVIQERKEKLINGEGNLQELSEEDELMGKKKRLVFLDLLLQSRIQNGQGLTDEEIREEVDTFMFAGHDTTTVTISWTLFTLSNFPHIQEKVHQELDEIFQGEERPITPQDVMKMQYLDRVIKETQRLIPVVPVIARTLEEDVEIAGRVVPAGVTMVIHLATLHKDPEQFPEPEVFDPDRFLPENIATRHPYSFIPFSAGPRNCLGQKFAQRNSKVLLATILRKLRVKSEKKLNEMRYNMEIVCRPQGGLRLAFEARN